MAITSAVCSSFKQELLQGKHDFDSVGGDTFKIALYTSSATLGAATTDYSATNEITNDAGSAYVAGGATLTNAGVSLSGTTDAVCIIAFGSDKTATNGTFEIQFPANDSSNAIIRLA